MTQIIISMIRINSLKAIQKNYKAPLLINLILKFEIKRIKN
jgi:hypothetical protein